MPDGGDALSGLRWYISVGLISEAPSGICRMAAMPYPAYVGTFP
ncbi:Hypothetical protein ABZS17D1_03055 [Kosakonia cowanii]